MQTTYTCDEETFLQVSEANASEFLSLLVTTLMIMFKSLITNWCVTIHERIDNPFATGDTLNHRVCSLKETFVCIGIITTITRVRRVKYIIFRSSRFYC